MDGRAAGRRVRIVEWPRVPPAGRTPWRTRVVNALAGVVLALVLAGGFWCGHENGEAQAYAHRMEPHDRAYEAADLAVARLHRELVARPDVPDDAAWREQLAAALDGLDRAGAAMAAAGPAPIGMRATGTLVDAIAADTHRLVGEYAAAVDAGDREGALHAADRLTAVQARRTRVRQALEEATRPPSGGGH